MLCLLGRVRDVDLPAIWSEELFQPLRTVEMVVVVGGKPASGCRRYLAGCQLFFAHFEFNIDARQPGGGTK